MELSAMKVKIINGNNGDIAPDFNSLPIIKNSGIVPHKGTANQWNQYIDRYGYGAQRDDACPFDEDNGGDSPINTRIVLIVAPSQFITEAVAVFGDVCTKLDEEALTTLWDTRIHKYSDDEDVSLGIMSAIKLKTDLSLTLSPTDLEAKDPENDFPGIRKNHWKTWTLFKSKKNITLV